MSAAEAALSRMRDRCLSIYNGPDVHRDIATIRDAFADPAVVAEAKAEGMREGLRAAADMAESIALSVPESETGWRVVMVAVDALRRAANATEVPREALRVD